MKNKFISVITSVIMLLTPCIGTTSSVAAASEQENNAVEICVDESLEDLNIYNLTERTNVADWILNLTGERLIKLDSQGYFVSGIADSWQIIPFPYETEDGNEEEAEQPNIEWPEWPENWEYGSLPLGYESMPPDTVLSWNENSFNFLNG